MKYSKSLYSKSFHYTTIYTFIEKCSIWKDNDLKTLGEVVFASMASRSNDLELETHVWYTYRKIMAFIVEISIPYVSALNALRL